MPKTNTLKLSMLTINRRGQVDFSVTGDTHCGPRSELRDGKIPVQYDLVCSCAPKLDERGFLFDQAMVDLWMRRVAAEVTDLSCEELVIAVAERFLAKMAKDKPNCEIKYLKLTLSPAPFMASISAEFGK